MLLEVKIQRDKKNLDIRSHGPHPSNFSQVHPQRDFRSNGLHPEKVNKMAQDAQQD